MHPNPVFRWQDRDAIRAFVSEIGFGTLFAATPDGPRAVHVPAIIDDDCLRLHLANGNALTRHLDGLTALFVVNGPDAYVSPDWYDMGPNQVPTWNYVAVELEGVVTPTDRAALMQQVDDLSAAHEQRLLPKTPWTRAKADPTHIGRMLDSITGFEMRIQAWRGTMKLGQNKPADARHKAADALEASGRRAIAHLMREASR